MTKQAPLFTGQDVTKSAADILRPVTLAGLHQLIARPTAELLALTGQLKKIRNIDVKAYHRLKVRLPYFIGASFTGNIRHSSNFVGIHYFVVDLDHLPPVSHQQHQQLRQQLRQDERVALMFTSPGGRGLKLLFRLHRPITDTALYSNFYRAFTAELSRHYHLDKHLDFKTSDATRVCFLAVDHQAWLNLRATPVAGHEYHASYDLFNQETPPDNAVGPAPGPAGKQHLPDDVYAEIRQKLNPKTPKRKKIIFVPQVLEKITGPVVDFAGRLGLAVSQVRDINYGKKFVFAHARHFAEINVFYGKSGFTVAISPKRGHHEELSQLAKALIEHVLYSNSPASTAGNNSTQMLARALKNINFN